MKFVAVLCLTSLLHLTGGLLEHGDNRALATHRVTQDERLRNWNLRWSSGDESFSEREKAELDLDSGGLARLIVYRGGRVVNSSHWMVDGKSIKAISLLVVETADDLSNREARFIENGMELIPTASDCFESVSIDFYSARKIASSTGDFACLAGSRASPFKDELLGLVHSVVLVGHST